MELMMNMSSSSSSSASRNSDLIRRISSNSSTILQMTNNNQQQQPQQPQQQPLLDTQITLPDVPAPATETVAASSKSGDDVWKEFVGGRSLKQEVPDEMMTLEDFLAKAGAVEEEDVKVPPQLLPSGVGGIFSHPTNVNADVFGIGAEEVGGRGKRRAILETLDKAAQQRQRRMIKNRESAARSRERKQAYQAELESLAVKLEEENAMLLKAKTEQTRKRYKQLMDNIIPVTEKQKPRRYVLKKVRSMEC